MEVREIPKELVYLTDDQPGYKRVKKGKGFCYYDKDGQKVESEKVLQRIQELGIPPIWKEVWIAQKANGHLQATGIDPKNRKQYLYHPLWNRFRNETKFSRMKEFGYALPSIRRITSEHISERGWPKEKVMALIIQMMDEHHIRIGNVYYKEHNETFGLTTLRRKHFEFARGVGHLEFKAKSGKYRKIDIHNGQLAKLIKKCSELPGYEIFKYKDADGKYHTIDSQDVNQYLKEISGEDFTCKDFRTWGGTKLAVDKYSEALSEAEENKRLNLCTTLIKKVSQQLGNTVSVCREYYIHPKVLQVLMDGKLERYKNRKLKYLTPAEIKLLDDSEIAVLNII